MIEIKINRKAFGGQQVLANIHFSLEKGETVALQGPSGIGKTTLLRILAGLDRDFDGSIGRPDKIAMVFQEPTLLPWRSALDNLTLVTGASKDTCLQVLDEVGLNGKQENFPNQLSLGQQRRLALARAFTAQPELLIMDEPFASLDRKRVEDILPLCRDMIQARAVTTLFVTHSEYEAEILAGRIIKLDGQPASIVAG